MIHSLMRKYPVGSTPAFMKARNVRWVTSCVLALVMVFAMLLLGHGFSPEDPIDVWELLKVPQGQPEQMSSQVNYDPKLMDTFFESDGWGYTYCPRVTKQEDTARAMCFSTGFGVKHLVASCEFRFADENSIDFLIYYIGPGFDDTLRVQVRGGMFTCQYSTCYPGAMMRPDFIWTTKHQELTLDKKEYRKGEVIKGRIDFECLQEATNAKFIAKHGKWPQTIKMWGVFKTTVQ